MFNATTTPIPDFTKEMVTQIIQAFDKLPLQTANIIWSIFISILKADWPILLLILFIIVLVATLKMMIGHWGMFGSVIYNILYFGVLLIIGLFKGPEVFVSDFYKPFCLIILYPLCYWITGSILDLVRNRFGRR